VNVPLTKQVGKLKHIPADSSNLDAWKAFFRERTWNSKNLLEQVRAITPDLVKYEKTNIRRINLVQWHSIFALVRHAITHSNSIITRKQLETMSNDEISLLGATFSGVWYAEEYTLAISKDEAIQAIQTTGEHSYLIFKCLSEAGGFDWTVIKPIQ
jgi:hypothetical protein